MYKIPYNFYKKKINSIYNFYKKGSITHIIFIKTSSIILVLNYIFYNIYPIISVKFTLSSISSALLA